jgi:hypothetical protein
MNRILRKVGSRSLPGSNRDLSSLSPLCSCATRATSAAYFTATTIILFLNIASQSRASTAGSSIRIRVRELRRACR